MLHVVLPVTYVFVTVGIFKVPLPSRISFFHSPSYLEPSFQVSVPLPSFFCHSSTSLHTWNRSSRYTFLWPSRLSFTQSPLINISIVIVHGSFTVLVILKPHAVITVVIHKIVDTLTMLLVLKPLPLILVHRRETYMYRSLHACPSHTHPRRRRRS